MAISTTSSQTVGRSQVDTGIQSPGLVVAARPVHIKTPKVVIDKRGARGLADKARGLASFVPVIDKMTRIERDTADQREWLVGQKLRLEAGEMDTAAFVQYQEDNDIHKGTSRARGFMSADGRARGHQDVQALNEWVKTNQANLITDEQFNLGVADFISKRLQGMEDPDFNANYLGVMQNAEADIRTSWAQDQFLTVQSKTRDNLMTGMRGDLITNYSQGGDNAMAKELARSYYDQAALSGIPRSAVTDMLVTNLENIAIETGNLDIFGKDAHSLGFFELDSPDMVDPSQRVPGLANSQEWNPKLMDVKQRVKRSISTATSKRNELAVLQHGYAIRDAADNGDFAKAHQLVDGGVAGELYGGASGLAMSDKLDADEALYRRAELMSIAYEKDAVWTQGATKKEIQTATDTWAAQTIANDENVGDQSMAVQMVAEKESRNAAMNTRTRDLLTMSSPTSTPGQFVGAVETFNRYNAINSNNLVNQIGKDKYRTYMLYNRKRLSLDEPNALSAVQRSDNPETRARMKGIRSGAQGAEIREVINDELIKGVYDQSWSIIDKDAVNSGYVRDRLFDHFTAFYAESGGDTEGGMQYAMKVFRASNQLVQSRDGKVRWVDTRGKPIPEDYAAAELRLSDEMKAKLGTDEDYYLIPDQNRPMSNEFMMMKSSNDMPLVKRNTNGINAIVRVDHGQMIQQHRLANMEADVAEAKAKAIADNTATQSTRRARKAGSEALGDVLEPVRRVVGDTLGPGLDALGDVTEPFTRLFKKPE